MINRISYTALGVALLAGASAANAQTVIEPAPTVETVRTVRTVERDRPVIHWHVARRAPARVVTTTTTRTIVRDRVVPAPAVIAPAPVATETYGDVVPPAPVAAAPFVGAAPAAQAGVPIPGYRYVYEADRILVIDPYTNIAVQAIPR